MKKLSQAPPGSSPPPASQPPGGSPPPGGGLEGLGASPMGGMPDMAGGGAPPGGAPADPAGPPVPIYSPLDSLGKILADVGLAADMKNHFDQSPDDSAKRIWMEYGGSPDGRTSIHMGERTNNPNPNQEQELENTKNAKWKRLPVGKGISDITDEGAISKTIEDGYFELSIQQHKQQPATASVNKWSRVAQCADNMRNFKLADEIDLLILNVYTPK